ncbi:MAG: hypothetical protein ACPGVU_05205 [Limisphaerales bacterium]
MYKLIKRNDDDFLYHEVWEEDGMVVEHFGEVGDPGERRVHPIPPDSDEDQVMESILRPVAAKGFGEVEDEELIRVHVEQARSPQGDDTDLDKWHQLEDQLDDLLGETGLGHCNGGEVSADSVVVYIFVVDAAIAGEVVANALDELKAFRRVEE